MNDRFAATLLLSLAGCCAAPAERAGSARAIPDDQRSQESDDIVRPQIASTNGTTSHPVSADSPGTVSDIHDRLVPAAYGCVAEFLAHLATRRTCSPPFRPDQLLEMDTKLMSLRISPNGVSFREDTPPGRTWRSSKAEVLQQVRDSSGPAYYRFAHLGCKYSIGHPNFSALTFTPAGGDGVVAHVGLGGYELTFDINGGQCWLSDVHYLVIELE